MRFYDKECDPSQLSPLTLAFVGDTVFDLFVRERLVCLANRPVNRLHSLAVTQVKASAQAKGAKEILEKLKEIALKENIKLAGVSALGATNDFTVGVYKVDEKKYYSNEFKGNFEIVSLTGTVNTMNGEFYAHMHMSAGNDRGEVFGGHLNRAFVSATCEMVISIIDGVVDRRPDEETGLKLFAF